MTDIINLLAALPADHPLARLRQGRPDALANAQRSFEALLEPADPGTFPHGERYAVAAHVARLHGAANATTFYAELLADEPAPDGPRLDAALAVAELMILRPRDATPDTIAQLRRAGWSEDDIVSLTQLVAFLAFQLRVVHGLQVLAGYLPQHGEPVGPTASTEGRFVRHPLGWVPWVAPAEELNDEQIDALIRPERATMPYFRLLARDPAALKARTLTDLDIFYNPDGGLHRAEREFAATVTSRFNGCEFCTSVHAARTVEEGGGAGDVDKLLADGPHADLADPRYRVLRDASLALTTTPVGYGAEHVAALRDAGLDERSILDHLYATAFFNWANRLMLVLGEHEIPARYRS